MLRSLESSPTAVRPTKWYRHDARASNIFDAGGEGERQETRKSLLGVASPSSRDLVSESGDDFILPEVEDAQIYSPLAIKEECEI